MKNTRHLSTAAGLALLLNLPAALADEGVEELVVTGTRAQPRSVLDSSVPIDVIGAESLAAQGSSDMNYMLRSVVPSFHVNMQPGRDSAALQNPINLRALAPDHALMLVNNKRRHRGASITWLSDGRSNGAQGPDISMIPGIAVRQVEVLRDGAAAQYGSDAIAGVINFLLKNDAEGAVLEVKHGGYDEDFDSEDSTRISGNIGLPLTTDGFLNLSFEYSEDSATDRSVLRDDVKRMRAAGNTHIADPAHIWGGPDIDDNIKTFFNLGMDLGADMRLYAFGNYARREVETGFFYREPEDETGLFAVKQNDGSHHPLLYGDASACAQHDVPLTAAGLPADLAGLLADDACFSYHEWFPGGFQPRFGGGIEDRSLVAGLRGTSTAIPHLGYDFSAGFGSNEAEYFIDRTVNPSWGPNSPTSFKPGIYEQTETNLNLDLSYPVEVGLASDLNIAAGLEWREEEFEIKAGDRASWEKGDYTTPWTENGNASAAPKNGSNGFGGFSPTAAGKWSRKNIATYLDLEVDVTPDWRVGGAVRWEDFDDFGTTTNAKLSTRMQTSERLALRASFGTGFRAPTPGQQNAYNISTVFDTQTGALNETGTVPSHSTLARKFGGKPLDSEESDNITLGAVLELGTFNITADYFRIDVEDRIFLSGDLDLTNETTLMKYGISKEEADALRQDFTRIKYFTNDFDTKTDGFDIVLTYAMAGEYGATDFMLSWNRTETEVTKTRAGSSLSANNIRWMEEGAPETRYVATVSHRTGDWRFMGRYNHFGGWYSGYDETNYSGYGLLDIEVSRRIGSDFTLTLGSDNVFDQSPDRSIAGGRIGTKYPRFSPGGMNGRFLYARARYEF